MERDGVIMFIGSPIYYDDAFVCSGTERSNKNQSVGQSSVRVYPNPANDQLNIEYLNGEESSIRFMLFNTQGQMIREITISPNQGVVRVPLSSLPNGVYWYLVPGLDSGKVIIQH